MELGEREDRGEEQGIQRGEDERLEEDRRVWLMELSSNHSEDEGQDLWLK